MKRQSITQRQRPAAPLAWLPGRRHGLVWAAGGMVVALQATLMTGHDHAATAAGGLLAVTAALGAAWLVEPYVRYRQRRRQYRRVLIAEGAWGPTLGPGLVPARALYGVRRRRERQRRRLTARRVRAGDASPWLRRMGSAAAG